MATRKRTWYTQPKKYLYSMVNWVCVPKDGVDSGGPDSWVRKIRFTLDLDGREIDTYLTPDEARGIAVALMRQANRLDEINDQLGNGGNYTDEHDWSVPGKQIGGTPDAPVINFI